LTIQKETPAGDSQVPGDFATPHVCEGGNLDCGSGLLLIIRRSMSAVPVGEVLEIRSSETSVREDLPAWCRMTKNPYIGWRPGNESLSFFVRRGDEDTGQEADYKRARDHRWSARVRWDGGLSAKVYCRNHSWTVGQPASFDLKDESPSAVELLLSALGGCLSMTFQILASRRGVKIDELEITLGGKINNIFVFLGAETQGHSGLDEITGVAYVNSMADEAVLEDIWRETLKASPVLNTLTRQLKVEIGMKAV
jgi:uncharacterized OsmC-like protein/TusA-related sulfurtransferase